MYQVKVFDEEMEDDLSDSVNEFLATLEEGSLKDIKFSVASFFDAAQEEQIFCFSALLIYST